jgi:hypothetical protein
MKLTLRKALHEMIDEMELEDIHYMVRKLKEQNFIVSDKDGNLVWVYTGPKRIKKMLKDCVKL